MTNVLRVILALAWIALPATGRAQDWASIKVQAVPVAPGLVMLSGAGGNLGVLVGEGGTLIVDSQFPQIHDKIVTAITASGGGDLFFSGGYPYVDITNGGSIQGTIAAADQILSFCNNDTRLIPGHGPLSDPKRLREYRAMLVTVRDRVAGLIAEGRTLEQAVAAKVSADLDGDWKEDGVTPEQFIALVYRDLSRERSGRASRH